MARVSTLDRPWIHESVSLSTLPFARNPVPDPKEQWDKVKGTYNDKEIEVLIKHFSRSRQQYTRVANSQIERLVDPIEVRADWSVLKGQQFKLKMQNRSRDNGYVELLQGSSICSHGKYFLLCVHLVLCQPSSASADSLP